MFVLLILVVGLGAGQFDMSTVEGHVGTSHIISDLAYAAGKAKTDEDAAEAVRQQIAEYKREWAAQLPKAVAGSRNDYMLRNGLKYLDTLSVRSATRDAVAFDHVDENKNTKRLFGFRGTAKLRDLVPDIQLAVNAKKVGRLDEARAFVERVNKEAPVEGKNMHFYGHSLGGYIAEGVRADHFGSRVTTVNGAKPKFFMKDGRVNAYKNLNSAENIAREFQARDRGDTEPHNIRFVVKADPISNGQSAQNIPNDKLVIPTGRRSILVTSLLRNHGLWVPGKDDSTFKGRMMGLKEKVRGETMLLKGKLRRFFGGKGMTQEEIKYIASKRQARTNAQVDDIKARWAASRARARAAAAAKSGLAKAGPARNRKPRSEAEISAIKARWALSRARASARSSASPRSKKPRTQAEISAIKARWALSRARASARSSASPRSKKPRTQAEISAIKARWALSRARASRR